MRKYKGLCVPPELYDLADAALAAGWRLQNTNKLHVRWLPPNGGRIVVTSGTPSDYRTFLNVRSQLRRSGLFI